MRRRVKKKYLTPMIHSIELDLVRPIATSGGGGVTILPGSGSGGPMHSKPYDLWEYDDETCDDETAYEYGW